MCNECVSACVGAAATPGMMFCPGCSAWRKESSREILEPLSIPKVALRELEREFFQEPGVTGQGEMALS